MTTIILIIAAFALCAAAVSLFLTDRLSLGWSATLGANCLFITQDILDGGTVPLIGAVFNAAAGLFCVLNLARLRREGGGA